jgi:APA family basic amino acid/polyamine antiporter
MMNAVLNSHEPIQDSLCREVPGTGLRKRLYTRDGVALIISNVIGVGIFTSPSVVAGLVPHPAAMMSLWIVGGLLALAGARSYAELARLYPFAGGEYVYLSRIYGQVAGFLSGWTSLIAGFTGAVAASAVGLAIYLGEYIPALSADRVFWHASFLSGGFTLSARTLTAAAVIATFAMLHSFTARLARLTQNSLALLIVVIIAAFVGCGFVFGHGSWSNFHAPVSPLRPVNWLLAMIPVMFTYSGWNAAAYVSEEFREVRKSIGPVLFLGPVVIVVLYAALNLLYLYAVPLSHMGGAVNIGGLTALSLFGAAGTFVTPMIILALLGAISAMTIAGPRVYFSMARDGVFIPSFSRTSRRFGTPSLAIWLQAVLSIVFVLCGKFEQLLMYTGFAIVLSSGVAVAGLFWVRRHRLRGAPFGMLIPAAFVLASAVLTVNAVLQSPRATFSGIVLIAAGVPVFYFTSRTARRVDNHRADVVSAD